jgi:hypothetical protein
MPTGSRNRPAAVAGTVTLAALALAIVAFRPVRDGDILREHYVWLPDFGLDLVLRMDGPARLFTVMVLDIGLLVLLYARYYMSRRSRRALLQTGAGQENKTHPYARRLTRFPGGLDKARSAAVKPSNLKPWENMSRPASCTR